VLYVSTRGNAPPRRFTDILLEGLAADGGLYVPEDYPKADLKSWRSCRIPILRMPSWRSSWTTCLT